MATAWLMDGNLPGQFSHGAFAAKRTSSPWLPAKKVSHEGIEELSSGSRE